MGKDSEDETWLKSLMLKSKNPFYIILILVFHFINGYLKIFKSKEIVFAICIILVSLVLLKDTIYKCFDRWCKRDETIEKEKTKQIIGQNKANQEKQENQENQEDCKIYEIKRKRKGS